MVSEFVRGAGYLWLGGTPIVLGVTMRGHVRLVRANCSNAFTFFFGEGGGNGSNLPLKKGCVTNKPADQSGPAGFKRYKKRVVITVKIV